MTNRMQRMRPGRSGNNNAVENLQLEPSLEEAFAERIKFEHDVISHRLTWLMTLNGFLIAATAVITTNREDIPGLLLPLYIVLSIVGSASNGSVLFSSWWATRAIQDAGNALGDWWSSIDLGPRDREIRRMRMRLYGRDPRSFQGYRRPTPSEWLHPWLLLPAVFVLTFMAMPQLGWLIAHNTHWKLQLFISDHDDGIRWTLLPMIVPVVFAGLATCDWVRHLEADRWAMCYGHDPTFHPLAGERISKIQAKIHHKKQRRKVRDWVNFRYSRQDFPDELLKKPRPWGRIDPGTYTKYREHQRLLEPPM